MATALDPSKIENLQMLEAVVSGPDDANRLFTITGSIAVNVVATNTSTSRQEPPKKEPFTLLLGPTLTRRQFHKAIAAVFPLAFTIGGTSAGGGVVGTMLWSVVDTDADWDDESQKVVLRFEVDIDARGNGSISLVSVGFQVTILAQTGDA